MLIKILLLFSLLPILLLSTPLQTRTQALMGTFVHISLEEQHNRQISQSFNLIRHIEHSLSSYDSEALVYRLNHTHQVPYDAYLAEAIEKSKQYYQDTQGYFDITIGSISKELYHFGEENSTIPSEEALKHAKLGIDAIEVNTTTIHTKEDVLILPLTSNLNRKGIIIGNKDIASGSLKKESVVIVPKITAIDASLLSSHHLLATLKAESFNKVTQELCAELECNS